jgi:hypothetical protein
VRLRFSYRSKHDPRVCGDQDVTASSVEEAARKVARARGLQEVWVHTADGEAVERAFVVVLPLPY